MKPPCLNQSAKRILRRLFAFLILFPLPAVVAQKVAATVHSRPGPSAPVSRPTWLPPDVDEKVPPVEETSCAVDEVVENAGQRILEFMRDVDRVTATESLIHQSINKHGQASPPVGRKFDYLVSIHEVRPGHLGVTEYRNGGFALNEFPGGIVTTGLPALVLMFHPYYVPSYEMTCEGLARLNDQLAWQVHFRQRPDKPNELKTYQSGFHGPSYSVPLKGRAWISAES